MLKYKKLIALSTAISIPLALFIGNSANATNLDYKVLLGKIQSLDYENSKVDAKFADPNCLIEQSEEGCLIDLVDSTYELNTSKTLVMLTSFKDLKSKIADKKNLQNSLKEHLLHNYLQSISNIKEDLTNLEERIGGVRYSESDSLDSLKEAKSRFETDTTIVYDFFIASLRDAFTETSLTKTLPTFDLTANKPVVATAKVWSQAELADFYKETVKREEDLYREIECDNEYHDADIECIMSGSSRDGYEEPSFDSSLSEFKQAKAVLGFLANNDDYTSIILTRMINAYGLAYNHITFNFDEEFESLTKELKTSWSKTNNLYKLIQTKNKFETRMVDLLSERYNRFLALNEETKL